MKIGIFTNNYLPNPYGVSGSVESFRQEFEALGHEVYVFAPHWKGYQDQNPYVFRYPSVDIEIKIKFPLAVPYSLKVSKVLKSLELDIIHSQHPNLLGSAAYKWAHKKNIPIVFTWHTLYDQYAHFVPFVPTKLAAWWIIRTARIFANKCEAVITPTKSIVDIIRNWGVTNELVEVIPTGVDEKLLSGGDRNKIRAKYGIQDDEILMLVVSRLTNEKNSEFLIDAVMDVLIENDKTKFMVVGGGDLQSKLERMTQEAGLNDRVFFTGEVPNSETKEYYAAGDIFVYASKSETQGMILTEAMYHGLPIVAVRATGVQDIVEDGKTGFLVAEDKKEFAAAVQKLLDDPELLAKYGEEARVTAREKYTSRVCAEKMIKLYESVINEKRKQAV